MINLNSKLISKPVSPEKGHVVETQEMHYHIAFIDPNWNCYMYCRGQLRNPVIRVENVNQKDF